jgi:hypothetical protein
MVNQSQMPPFELSNRLYAAAAILPLFALDFAASRLAAAAAHVLHLYRCYVYDPRVLNYFGLFV